MAEEVKKAPAKKVLTIPLITNALHSFIILLFTISVTNIIFLTLFINRRWHYLEPIKVILRSQLIMRLIIPLKFRVHIQHGSDR